MNHQKDGRRLALVGVTQRVRDTMKVAHVSSSFRLTIPSLRRRPDVRLPTLVKPPWRSLGPLTAWPPRPTPLTCPYDRRYMGRESCISRSIAGEMNRKVWACQTCLERPRSRWLPCGRPRTRLRRSQPCGAYAPLASRCADHSAPQRGNPGKSDLPACAAARNCRCHARRGSSAGNAVPVHHALYEVVALHPVLVSSSSRQKVESVSPSLLSSSFQ